MSEQMISMHDELKAYIRQLADSMGLRDWRIDLSLDAPEEDDHEAVCRTYRGQNVATLYVANDWRQQNPQHLRMLICHELLHCHGHRMGEPLNALIGEMTAVTWRLVQEMHEINMELMVDNIARAWAETLPLPLKAPSAEAA